MRLVMRCGGWMAAVLFCAVSVGVLAQETPPAKSAPQAKPVQSQDPAAEQMLKFQELEQRINRLLRETAQTHPEIKALFDAQQSKWLDINKKRADITASDPELKKLREPIDAKRKQEQAMVMEIVSKNPELAEMQKQFQELQRRFEVKMREVAGTSPELQSLHNEIGALRGKYSAALEANPELKKMNAEMEASSGDILKKAAAASPELAKAIAERDALMKGAAPAPAPGPAPKAKEQAK